MTLDRSFVERNRASTDRIRALAARLSDAEMQHPVGEHWTVAIARARLVDPQGCWPAVSYALFAKSGFTPALVARAADENVRLVAAEALVTDDPGQSD